MITVEVEALELFAAELDVETPGLIITVCTISCTITCGDTCQWTFIA